MPKAVVRPSARRRVFIVFSVVLTIFLGFFSLERLPVDFLLSQNAPRLRVQVSAPGLTAIAVEEKITQPLAAAVSGISGAAAIESISSAAASTVDVVPRHYRDIEQVQREIATRLEQAKRIFPPAIAAPVLTRIDDASVAARLAVTSHRFAPLALRDWAEDELARRLQELPGVATVELKGGDVREIVVMPDQRRLAGLGLEFGDIIQAIQKGRDTGAQVSVMPRKTPRRRELMPLGNVAAVAAMPVALPSGENLSLSEVAKISLRAAAPTDTFRFEGVDAVGLSVQKQARSIRSEVAERVQSHIEWMRANRLIPEGIEIHFLSKRWDQVRQSLKQIANGFFGAVVLVLIAAYVLLGSGRRVFILGAIMLTSIFSIFVLMALSRSSLDVMSLGGLVLMPGILGVSGLLMFENSRPFPHRRGFAALSSVIAAATAVPAAIVPFLFVNTEINILFRDFILVSMGVWIISVLWTLMIVPAFDARRRNQSSWNAIVSYTLVRTRHSYGRSIRAMLRRRYVLAVLALIFMGVLTAAIFVKKPAPVPLPDSHTGAAMVLRIHGPDPEKLPSIANDIVQRLSLAPSLRDIRHSAQVTREDLVLQMDEVRAHELGVDATEAGRALAIALTGISLGHIRDAEHRYDLRLRLPPADTNSMAAWGRILLLGEWENRPAVYLRDVATLERKVTAAEIRRVNGKPTIELRAATAPQALPDRVRAEVHEALKGYTLPENYYLSGDAAANTGENQGENIMGLGLGLFLILLTQTLFQRSFRAAMLISFMALITVTGVGAVWLLFGMPLSPPVCLGMAMLAGLTAVQAVMVITPLNALHAPAPVSAIKIVRAVKNAPRPLFAMTLMTILGMLPFLVSSATAILHPLIAILIAGILLSLLGNLFFTPLLYFFVLGEKQQTPATRRP